MADSQSHQENAEVLNAHLASLATEQGITFINHDPSLKLCDGSVDDGLHLTYKGTNQLVKNLQLEILPGAKDTDATKQRQYPWGTYDSNNESNNENKHNQLHRGHFSPRTCPQ